MRSHNILKIVIFKGFFGNVVTYPDICDYKKKKPNNIHITV